MLPDFSGSIFFYSNGKDPEFQYRIKDSEDQAADWQAIALVFWYNHYLGCTLPFYQSSNYLSHDSARY